MCLDVINYQKFYIFSAHKDSLTITVMCAFQLVLQAKPGRVCQGWGGSDWHQKCRKRALAFQKPLSGEIEIFCLHEAGFTFKIRNRHIHDVLFLFCLFSNSRSVWFNDVLDSFPQIQTESHTLYLSLLLYGEAHIMFSLLF